MGEAFIVGRGDSSSSGTPKLVTNIFTTNGVFVVPNARNQQFTVRIFGGGGGGGCATNNFNMIAGGGGGFMNNAVLTLQEGKAISVQIGTGGKGANVIVNENTYPTSYTGNNGSGGGTTSFGTYLSALGGFGGNSYMIAIGGSGGSGGGCSGRKAGDGYQFGGGGGWGLGGKWGGGGGLNQTAYFASDNPNRAKGGCLYNNINAFISNTGSESSIINAVSGYSANGGRGGDRAYDAQNGTNTIGMNLDYTGKGLAGNNNGNSKACGGGGYGGCGGIIGGGGGGYGANGGDDIGGGGGYGGRGGSHYGGGGAYGAGGDGYAGSGGPLPSDGSYGGGGGGGYANNKAGNGGNGICIIQYYT